MVDLQVELSIFKIRSVRDREHTKLTQISLSHTAAQRQRETQVQEEQHKDMDETERQRDTYTDTQRERQTDRQPEPEPISMPQTPDPCLNSNDSNNTNRPTLKKQLLRTCKLYIVTLKTFDYFKNPQLLKKPLITRIKLNRLYHASSNSEAVHKVRHARVGGGVREGVTVCDRGKGIKSM